MAFDNVTPTGPRAFETPFLDRYVIEPAIVRGGAGLGQRRTPFLSEYDAEEAGGGDPMAELVDELLESLHDDELDEAIGTLTDDLREMFASEPALEGEDDDVREARVRETLAPLLRMAEADVVRVGDAIQALDLEMAGEAEIQEAVDATPMPEAGSPAFEFFLKSLRGKIRTVTSGALSVARKLASPVLGALLGRLLAQLRTYLKPLIEKVAKFAMNKVPKPYQPMVAALAARLGGQAPAPAAAPLGGEPAPSAEPASTTAADPAAAATPQDPAIPDTAQAQEELDLALAEAALAGDRADEEVMGAGVPDRPIVARDPYAELSRARARFVREVTEAGTPEEAEVAVERFVPAVLMVVRQAVRMIGRTTVVNKVGALIAQLIGPLVGKANAPALGKVLADVGLRTFLQAEVDADTEREAAGEAIAATVEDTVRRVAEMSDEVLQDPEALAATVHEAFQGAAAANLPSTLVRPELRETERPGVWVSVRRHRRARARYRKFTHPFDVTVTPSIARSLRGYGSSTVAGLFRDRLRLRPDSSVPARMHLYEAVPGTSLAAIAGTEEARGLGSTDPEVWSQIQPLTPEAALLLLGSPRLGRELPDDAEPTVPLVGQRFYYLEVADGPSRPLGRESQIRVAVDLRQDAIRLNLYLSEVAAQKIASALRAKAPAAAVVANLRSLLAPAAGALGSDRVRRIVRVLGVRRYRSARTRAGAMGRAARRALRRQIADLALQWAWTHLAAHLASGASDLVARTEGPEDGVRLVFSFQVPGGLAGVGKVFRGQGAQVAGWPPAAPTRTTLTIKPGPRHA